MIKIYFNPACPELIFSIAAIMSSRNTAIKGEEHLVVFIAAYPWEMSNEEHLLKKEIILRAEDMAEEIASLPEDEVLISVDKIYEEISSEDEIIILNIHPMNREELAHLMAFFEKNQEHIKLWIDSSNYWDENVIAYLRTYGSAQIFIDKDLSCLQLLKRAGIKILPEWEASAQALARGDAENYWSARYIAALSAACIIDNNQNEEIKNYFYSFAHAVNEVWQGKRSELLDELVQDFIESEKNIQKLKKNLKTETAKPQNQIFPAALAVGRPIGYLALKDINPALDLTSLLEYGSEKFPWLFLIYYNIGDDYNILAYSKELPIEIIENRLADFSDRLEILLPILEKEVINFKK